jgi:hypothetical protein
MIFIGDYKPILKIQECCTPIAFAASSTSTVIWEIGVNLFSWCPEQRNLDTVKAVVPHEFALNKHLNNDI